MGMGKIILIVVILIFVMCFCLYNWWFQREKYKTLMDSQKEKLNPLNSPTAWGIYSALSILATFSLIMYYSYKMILSIMNMNS